MAARMKAARLGHTSRPSLSLSATGLRILRILLLIFMMGGLTGDFPIFRKGGKGSETREEKQDQGTRPCFICVENDMRIS